MFINKKELQNIHDQLSTRFDGQIRIMNSISEIRKDITSLEDDFRDFVYFMGYEVIEEARWKREQKFKKIGTR